MEKNTKLIAGLMIAILAASALAIAPVIFAEEIDPDSFEASTQVGGAMNRRKVRHPLLRYILKNGEYAQLTGTVVVQKGSIIMLSIEEASTVFVLVPPLWVVEGEILNRTDMFDGSLLSIEATVTMETLKVDYTKDSYEITVYIAYEISGDGVDAKALLPLNINVVDG
jgi:hypothetical protein